MRDETAKQMHKRFWVAHEKHRAEGAKFWGPSISICRMVTVPETMATCVLPQRTDLDYFISKELRRK